MEGYGKAEVGSNDTSDRHNDPPFENYMRINDQYRVTFRWEQQHAYEVRVEDYH